MGRKSKGHEQLLDDEYDDESEDIGLPPQRIGGLEEAGDDYDDDEVVHIVGCLRDEDCDCGED